MNTPIRTHPAALPQPPAWAQAALDRLRGVVRALPVQPPSIVAAAVLDRLLLPRLDAAQRAALLARPVEVEVVDFGLRIRLKLGQRGFAAARADEAPALTIRARFDALWALARGTDDADRLFFDRQLVMEGDTEFGLVVKNTLDAIGPLWR